MRGFGLTIAIFFYSITSVPGAFALSSGTDVLVPAAARGAGQGPSTWLTDLYVLNPGGQAVSVEIFWLERNQANPSPISQGVDIGPGETIVLGDVLLRTFGLTAASGAFRVVASAEVVVSSRIYNLQGSVTFGQGFEGVPRSSALGAGASTDIVGLANSDSFRTNLVVMDASGSSSRVVLILNDESGNQIASRDWALDGFEPQLSNLTSIFSGLGTFDYATLHVEVTEGSVIVAASKVDNDPATGDPTTLVGWSSPGPASTTDGTYQLAIYDSYDFATGGRLVVADGEVTAISASYLNLDKLNSDASPECREVFLLTETFAPPVSFDELANGLVIEQSYDAGELSFTLTLTVSDNLTISGTVETVGSDFPLISTGCNGAFPALTVLGGKSE